MKKLVYILTSLIFAFTIFIRCQKENEPPVIKSITANPQNIKTGEMAQISCTATDTDGDQLTYSWSSSNGTFPNGQSGNAIIWEAPEQQGEYVVSVTVDDGQNIVDGFVTISVEANPEITVDFTNLDFLAGFGTEGTQINIQNTGTGTLTWTISVDASWLNVSPTSGETTTETDQIEIIAVRDDLEPGTYLATITINSNAGDQQINVSMEVNSLQGTYVDSRDNHQYRWVKIGEQIWMAENLQYDSGDGCWVYDNDENNLYRYGRLYSWDTALQACPAGWHLPTDIEWEQLAQYVSKKMGPYFKDDNDWWDEIGKHLKATFGWDNDGNGTDDFGFFAFPGGYHDNDLFGSIKSNGVWWSSTKDSLSRPWCRNLNFSNSKFIRFSLDSDNYEDLGYSVRCLKD